MKVDCESLTPQQRLSKQKWKFILFYNKDNRLKLLHWNKRINIFSGNQCFILYFLIIGSCKNTSHILNECTLVMVARSSQCLTFFFFFKIGMITAWTWCSFHVTSEWCCSRWNFQTIAVLIFLFRTAASRYNMKWAQKTGAITDSPSFKKKKNKTFQQQMHIVYQSNSWSFLGMGRY